jgi:two-component system OmpR family response regulator
MDVTQTGDTNMDSSGRALDVLVGRLRGKIEDNPKNPALLKTERGVGYIFAVDVTQTEI